MSDGQWFYLAGETRQGPFTTAQMIGFLDAGVITRRTKVWREGLKAPRPFKAIRALSKAVRADREARGLIVPVRRLFARLMDLGLFWVLVFIVPLELTLTPLLQSLPNPDAILFGAALVSFCLAQVLEALVLARFGTTPGKWLFGLALRTPDGKRLSFLAALKRTLLVFVLGCGCFLPLLNLMTLAISYQAARRGEPCFWDWGTGREVYQPPAGRVRFFAESAFFLLLPILVAVTIWQAFNEHSALQKTLADTVWTNPVTGVSAQMPFPWSFASQHQEVAQKIYVFVLFRARVTLAHQPGAGLDLTAFAAKAQQGNSLGTYLGEEAKVDAAGNPYRELRFDGVKDDVLQRIWPAEGDHFWTLTLSIDKTAPGERKQAEQAADLLWRTLKAPHN